MVHLSNDYIVYISFDASKEDKQFFSLATMYEHVSLRELDNSIKLVLSVLDRTGCQVKCAEVRNANTGDIMINKMFLSLMNIPEPVTRSIKNG